MQTSGVYSGYIFSASPVAPDDKRSRETLAAQDDLILQIVENLYHGKRFYLFDSEFRGNGREQSSREDKEGSKLSYQ